MHTQTRHLATIEQNGNAHARIDDCKNCLCLCVCFSGQTNEPLVVWRCLWLQLWPWNHSLLLEHHAAVSLFLPSKKQLCLCVWLFTWHPGGNWIPSLFYVWLFLNTISWYVTGETWLWCRVRRMPESPSLVSGLVWVFKACILSLHSRTIIWLLHLLFVFSWRQSVDVSCLCGSERQASSTHCYRFRFCTFTWSTKTF